MKLITDEIATGFLIHDVSRIRKKIVDNALSHIDLSRSQRWVLAHIVYADKNGISQAQLAKKMNVGKVSIGRTIQRLENNGLVQRQSDPDDRRIKKVLITEQGEIAAQEMSVIAIKLNQQFMKNIKPEQHTGLKDSLQTMLNNMLELDKESE